MIKLIEFDLPEPDNYKEICRSADELFAELLIRCYYAENKCLTDVNDRSIVKETNGRSKNEQLPISERGCKDSQLHKAGDSKENLERLY